jgi:predicted nucleic-acid-binding protein
VAWNPRAAKPRERPAACGPRKRIHIVRQSRRLFDRTDRSQTRAVEGLIVEQAQEGCLLNPIVLCEFAWTLDRTYKVSRGITADHIDRILEAPEFIVPFADEATAAAGQFRRGPADFADYYFAEINRTLGCSTTMTFNRDAAKEGGLFTLLAS